MTITFETLPAVECTPWCYDGTGHTDATHREDQWCHGPQMIVKLTRMPLHFFREGDIHQQWLDDFRVYLRRENEGRTHVHLGRGEAEGFEMTISEVAALRDNLTLLLVEAGDEA